MPDQTQTMIANMPAKTGRSLDEWLTLLAGVGLDTHGAIVDHMKRQHGVSYGFANLIAHRYRESAADEQNPGDLVDAQYSGPKAGLRQVYDVIVDVVRTFGDDVEIAPKKQYVSLRRRKQFAQIGPATRTRIDVGLNLKDEPASARARAVTGMCTHKVAVTSAEDVDDELVTLLRRAYELA